MKTKILFTSIVAVICFIFIGTVYSLDMNFTDILLNSTGGITYAMAVGTITTQTIANDSIELLKNPLSQTITKMQPSRNPLDTIIRKVVLHRKAQGWKSEWYEVDTRAISTTLAETLPVGKDGDGNGEDSGASGTSYDLEGGTTYTMTLASVAGLNLDDNIMADGIVEPSTLTNGVNGLMNLVFHITAKNTADHEVDVKVLTEDGILPVAIPEGTTMIRIGNTKQEEDAITKPFSVWPQKIYNYNQIHMSQVEETAYARLHEKEVQWGMTDHKAQSLYDLRRSFEATSLFGRRHMLITDDNKIKYFSGGILGYITQKFEYTVGSVSNETVLAIAKKAFTGNSGSDKRFFFMGKDLKTEWGKNGLVSKQLGAESTEVVYGITFNKFITDFGILYTIHHDLFNDYGWADKGAIIDVTQLEKHVFSPMQARIVDFKKTGVKNVTANIFEETFCIATRYPKTHLIVKPNGE